MHIFLNGGGLNPPNPPLATPLSLLVSTSNTTQTSIFLYLYLYLYLRPNCKICSDVKNIQNIVVQSNYWSN